MYYPFIDHVVSELETRFTNEHEGLIAAQHLVPAYLETLTEKYVDKISTYHGKFILCEEHLSLN